MKFEVPQFVDVEDRIIGPLTWRQFVFLAGGLGAGVICFLILPFWAFLLVGSPFILLGAGLAFYQVNNRPLAVILEAMTTYFSKSRLYLWQRQGATPEVVQPVGQPNSSSLIAPTPQASGLSQVAPANGSNLASLSRKLEVRAIEGNVAEQNQ